MRSGNARYAVLLLCLSGVLPAADWERHIRDGESLEQQGKYAASVSEFEAALHEMEGLGPDDWRLPVALHNLGTVYRETGRYAEAERCYQRAITIFETEQPERKAELAATLNNLGALNLVLERVSRAGALYRRAYELCVGALGPMHRLTGVSLLGLAQVAQEKRQFAEAAKLYSQAARILESAEGADSLMVAHLRHNWGLLDRDWRRDNEARPLLESAAAIYQKTAPRHPKRAIILRSMADLETSAGSFDRAGALFAEALDICAASLPPDHPQTGVILQAYSRYLYRVKRKKEAQQAAERARMILAKSGRESGRAYTVDATTLGLR